MLGGALLALGRAGERGAIGFALGGWTEKNSTPESWRRAHEIIGRGLMRCGWVLVVLGVAIAALSTLLPDGLLVGLAILGFVVVTMGPLFAIVPAVGVVARQ